MAITISTPTLYTLTGNKNKILVTTDTSGVTAHFLHLKIDVFKSDGVTIIDSFTDKLPVINGKATFEIQEFLRQKQTGNFTELIVNHQEHDLVVSYTLSAFETYDYSNTEQNTIIDPTLYYAIQGKIGSEYELRLETLASTFYADWLQANKFLTNKPRILNQLTNERLKLYYLALATESVDLICDIVFADASTSSITIETISMTQNKIYELLVGFTELKLAAQETTSKIASYKIYLQTTAWTSEVFEITIERDYYPNQHQFIFKNAFGVYDTILFRGIQENNKSYENVFGSINNKQLAVSKIATNSFSTASGILPYSIKSWIWEFSNSLDAYSIVGDIIYSIIIKNESDVSIVDNSFLYGHIVKYEQVNAVKQVVEYVPKIVIDVSITDYTTQTTGITLNFTGSVKGKYDDGNEFDFVSGNENLRTYTANGSYRLVIYGDLETITAITADNSNITTINNLKTGNLGGLFLNDNNLTSLDLSDAKITSGGFYVQNNVNLSSILFSTSSIIQNINISNTAIQVLDLSNINVSGTFTASNNNLLTSILFASTGNGMLTNFNISNTSIQVLDLSNINVSGKFTATNNNLLTSILFASTGNGNIQNLTISNNQLITSLDFTNVSLSYAVIIQYNNTLNTIALGNTNGSLAGIFANGNDLIYIDLTKFQTSTGIGIRFENNNMLQTEVDNQIQNTVDTNWINNTLTAHGTNAAPSTAGEANIDILRSRGWTVTVTGGY